LQREFGAAGGKHLWSLSWGRDERKVTPRAPEKSVGAEETFAADIGDPEVIRGELLRLSGRTARALRASGHVARTVVVKLRLANFKTITRSRTLDQPTDVTRDIYEAACALYQNSGLDRRARLRLVGVRVTGLRVTSGSSVQLTFDDRPVGWREAEQAVDKIDGRFGEGAVRPGTLLRRSGRPPARRPSDSGASAHPSSKAR
jgi:DNA polymerase-4